MLEHGAKSIRLVGVGDAAIKCRSVQSSVASFHQACGWITPVPARADKGAQHRVAAALKIQSEHRACVIGAAIECRPVQHPVTSLQQAVRTTPVVKTKQDLMAAAVLVQFEHRGCNWKTEDATSEVTRRPIKRPVAAF